MRKWLLSSAIALNCLSLNAENYYSEDFFSNLHMEASWLYWKVDGSNYNFLNTKTVDPTIQIPSENATETRAREDDSVQKMPWDSGFRVGFGFLMPCLGVDVKLAWSDFHSTSSKKIFISQPTAPNARIAVEWPFTADNIQMTNAVTTNSILDVNARQKISFDFDPVNLEFGKWISFDCFNMAFRPHVGLQYLQYQDDRKFHNVSNVANLPQGTTEYRFKQRFEGFGLRGGFDVAMPLFCDLTLVGNVAASIDWGRNKYRFSSDIGANINNGIRVISNVHTKKSEHISQTLIDLGLGLRWETCLCDCYQFSLEALWEQHQLINGSRLWVNAGTLAPLPSNPDKHGDLTLRGLSLTAGLAF